MSASSGGAHARAIIEDVIDVAPGSVEADRRQGGWMLLVGGVVLVVAGLVAGLTHLAAYGVDCGSVFSPAGLEAGMGLGDILVDTACHSARNSRRVLTLALLVIGVVCAILGARLVATSRRPRRAGGVPNELTRLAELHAAGVLTDEEYAAAKARVIGG